MLGRRAPARERWASVRDLIWGHCEEYESPEDTLARELSEEIDITPINFTPFAAIKDSVLGYTFLVYLVTEWARIPRICQLHEHSEIRWFPITEALKLDLALPDDYPAVFRSIALVEE